jgi:hypothetical protein
VDVEVLIFEPGALIFGPIALYTLPPPKKVDENGRKKCTFFTAGGPRLHYNYSQLIIDIDKS